MKYYSILFILFVFNSCDNVSILSNSDASNLAKIKVNITIKDGTKKNSLDYVKVKLSDGKKQIINKNIKILLNSKPLELFVRQGNYYEKHAYYGTDDLLRNESYYFEIILPDSSKYPLAFIKPLKRRDNADYLKVSLNSKENGLVNPELMLNSKISYTYVVEETIDLEE